MNYIRYDVMVQESQRQKEYNHDLKVMLYMMTSSQTCNSDAEGYTFGVML